MKPQCPECGSRHISDELETFDGEYEPWAWWTCLECGHSWRYQDGKENPDGDKNKETPCPDHT